MAPEAEGVKEGSPPRDAAGKRPALLGPVAMGIVLFSLAGSVHGLLLFPRPTAPRSLPWIVLDRDRVKEQLEIDARRAATVRESDAVFRVEQLWLEQGQAEIDASEPEDMAQRRARSRAHALHAVRSQHGDDAVAALRSRVASRVLDALGAKPEFANGAAFLGGFPSKLTQYGLVENNRIVAPRLVVRALFKARWNAAFGLNLTEGLRPIELQAYWGWLAVGAPEIALTTRQRALDDYQRAGGTHVDEIRGALAFMAQQSDRAVSSYTAAYEATGNIRLRNHALAGAAGGRS